MKEITISNYSFYDKDYLKTFAKQDKYKFFNVNEGSSILVPMYRELLREVLGDKVDEVVKDCNLSIEETREIQIVMEREIKKYLNERDESKINGFARRTLFGKEYELDLKLNDNNDRIIEDMNIIYLIGQECLDEGRSIYIYLE